VFLTLLGRELELQGTNIPYRELYLLAIYLKPLINIEARSYIPPSFIR